MILSGDAAGYSLHSELLPVPNGTVDSRLCIGGLMAPLKSITALLERDLPTMYELLVQVAHIPGHPDCS